MSEFKERIKTQVYEDNNEFSRAAKNLSNIITNNSRNINYKQDSELTAIKQILSYHGIKEEFNLPVQKIEFSKKLNYILYPHGIMYREIKLKDQWHKDCIGPMIIKNKCGDVVALLPRKFIGYDYYDYKSGLKKKINKANVSEFSGDALVFFKPLPQKELEFKDLIKFIFKTISIADYLILAFVTVLIAIIGLLIPEINSYIFSYVVTNNNFNVLSSVSCALLGVTIATSLMGISKALIISRLKTKLDTAVESASMIRVLSLPVSFFKDYSSGELLSRVQTINDLCSMIEDAFLTTGLTSVFSLVYIGSIIKYAPVLVVPSLTIFALTSILLFISISLQIKINRKRMLISAKQSGLEFSLISGIQKLKISGAERRSFTKWMNLYKENAKLQYDPPVLLKIYNPIFTAITLLGTIMLYYLAVISNISIGDYMAFNVSFGLVQGAFASIINVALIVANFKPKMELIEPILKALPETSSSKKIVTSLSGKIELKNISFKYGNNSPFIINNLSLKIHSGEYVAIVGKTGCGKSTLIRILLAFEHADAGSVYYDEQDIRNLDLTTLRKNISTVLQNSKLFQDDIYSNISICNPNIPLEDVWKAAKMAGIDKDIENMPMGMNTIISEAANGGISGGQRQRIMIARSFASKNNILIFDEATSALDNLAQNIVLRSLEKLNCTRIIVAHRLSTVKHCDRIIVLNDGKIVEDGSYEMLINKRGEFFNLVNQQSTAENLSIV